MFDGPTEVMFDYDIILLKFKTVKLIELLLRPEKNSRIVLRSHAYRDCRSLRMYDTLRLGLLINARVIQSNTLFYYC